MNRKKKRICVIGPSLKMGGMERASCNMANAIQNDDVVDVSYIAIFKQQVFFKLNKNINFIEPPKGTNVKRLNFFKTIFWLRKEIKHLKPDVILVYNFFYSAIVLTALFKTKNKIYISNRASPLYKWPFFIKVFNNCVFKLIPPAGVLAQTSVAKEYQKKQFSKKTPIKVIPNILRAVNKYNLEKENQILAVGRLGDHLKGFDRLVKAFEHVDSSWKLVFAGGDKEGKELKLLSRDLKIEDRVIFLGKVKDIDKVFSQSKIFVIPSRSEGFPNALCEAMASGLACISFDFIAGPRDIIESGVNGLIVENGNIEKLSGAINELIANDKLRHKLGENAEKIKEKLNKKVIVDKVLDFIVSN